MTGCSPRSESPLTESNRRPSPYHGDALPTELRGQVLSCPTLGFLRYRRSAQVVHSGHMASNLTVRDRRSYPLPGVGELTALLPSWRLHPEASNLSPRTIRAYTD